MTEQDKIKQLFEGLIFKNHLFKHIENYEINDPVYFYDSFTIVSLIIDKRYIERVNEKYLKLKSKIDNFDIGFLDSIVNNNGHNHFTNSLFTDYTLSYFSKEVEQLKDFKEMDIVKFFTIAKEDLSFLELDKLSKEEIIGEIREHYLDFITIMINRTMEDYLHKSITEEHLEILKLNTSV